MDDLNKRFPQYVRNWVRNHADRVAQPEDLEDWSQDLLIHLRHLPSMSKHREAGKEDIVQMFDPRKHYGANQARFQNYINLCLTNKFRTLHSKHIKDALSQPGIVSLDTQKEWGDPFTVDDEYCHAHSEHLRRAANVSGKRSRDRAFVQRFTDFVRLEDPDVLSALDAVLATGTLVDAADQLGISESRFTGIRNRLRQLGRCFLSGEPAPRQRKPYKERVKHDAVLDFATAA